MTEITDWLSNNLLIDLQPIVLNTIILGEESYSIKRLKNYIWIEQKICNPQSNQWWHMNFGEILASLLTGKLEDGLSPMLEEIRLYNKDDLVSTINLINGF